MVARSVDGDTDALGLLRVELKVAGDKRAMLRGPLAFKGIEKPATFHGILSRHRCRGSGFTRTGDRESSGNVQAESCRVAVRGVIGQGEPARGQKQVRAVFGNGSGTDARDGAVFFIEKQA